jgi:LmbE family N-acetylglucosaminyl deacetylase
MPGGIVAQGEVLTSEDPVERFVEGHAVEALGHLAPVQQLAMELDIGLLFEPRDDEVQWHLLDAYRQRAILVAHHHAGIGRPRTGCHHREHHHRMEQHIESVIGQPSGGQFSNRPPAFAFLILRPRRANSHGVARVIRPVLSFAASVVLLAQPVAAGQHGQPLKGIGTPSRLLVVAPHPDDAALAAGGLIQRVTRHGGAVHVIVITSGDGFLPGVALETHKAHPQPDDFRAYAHLRQRETIRGLGVLGVVRRDVDFLGFPDRGLCPILEQYRFDRPPYYRSPFTAADRPPATDALVPSIEYDAPDLERELRRVIVNFRATLIVIPDGADEHPDHCAAYFLVRAALHSAELQKLNVQPTLLTYVIHFDGWPAGQGSTFTTPRGFPVRAGWIRFPLSAEETARKREAVEQYKTQMDVMGGFLLEFVRPNELFVVDAERADDGLERRCCAR